MKKPIFLLHIFVLVIIGSGRIWAQENPMGNTWVVFIENSNYETFNKLDGPAKDAISIKGALSNYQISNFIHKQDMTKTQMERFFSIELRDLVEANKVKSLMIWYAGHGKYINNTGYWIPVDSKMNDEFTYYNVNGLKASLKSYINVTHILIVSDASEAGTGFYQAMRMASQEISCDNLNLASYRSAQVFSSAGFEAASDNSVFAKSFSNTLISNPNSCIPVESLVKNVTGAVVSSTQQRPKFGKIAGLPDENGTFFFIKK